MLIHGRLFFRHTRIELGISWEKQRKSMSSFFIVCSLVDQMSKWKLVMISIHIVCDILVKNSWTYPCAVVGTWATGWYVVVWRPPPWAGGMLAGNEVGINSPFGPICIEPIGKYAMFILNRRHRAPSRKSKREDVYPIYEWL